MSTYQNNVRVAVIKILMQFSCMILKISSEESSSWLSEQLRLAEDINFWIVQAKSCM